ncbi:LPXTG cell wall anchor domain-containing protein [Solidesulfovibrio sp. C21]
MSMNDLAIIAGAIVVLALIGFVFYKRVIKN